MIRTITFVLVYHFTSMPLQADNTEQPIVIAHRGASGYLPEHSLAGAAMAHAMGADFVEPDVILTKDDQPIVFHDLTLDAMTNVKTLFPNRKRVDGHWYAIDFSLKEIKTLSLRERRESSSSKTRFKGRFPGNLTLFTIPTLDEFIQMIQGLNKSRAKKVGIYPEIKHPSFHRAAEKDITAIVLKTLQRYGYTSKNDRIFVQSFDPSALKRARFEFGSKLPLIQLIGHNLDPKMGAIYARMKTAEGLKGISQYADGIGIWIGDLLITKGTEAYELKKELVKGAHAAKLKVHVFTLRKDQLPPQMSSWKELLTVFYRTLKVDGAFTDFPDAARTFLRENS